MIQAQVLAKRYATALGERAQQEGLLEKVAGELAEYGRLVETSPELHTVMCDPRLPARGRAEMLQATLTGRFSPLTISFLLLLVRKRRENYLKDITIALQAFVDAAQGVVQADVRTAVPLTATEEQALQESLAGIAGKKVRLHSTVDPAVLGGVIAQVGGKSIDGTVAGHLRRLQQTLQQGKVAPGSEGTWLSDQRK